MRKIGARAHDYGRDTPDRLFGRIRGYGYSCVQLAFQKAITGIGRLEDVTPQTVELAAAAARRHSLSIAVLGAYVDPVLPEEALCRRSAELFIRSIPAARRLGAGCIGTETTNRAKLGNMTSKEAHGTLLRFLERVLPAAEQEGVTVALEPVYYHTLATPEDARDVLRTIASPNLKIIFDPVNLLAPEEFQKQAALWQRCFECFGDRIAALHLKGVRADEAGKPITSDFSHSIVDYEGLADGLRQLPGDFSVLREEGKPETAAEDFEFLTKLMI